MRVQDQATSSVNDTGTNGKIDTPLTQLRSLDVRAIRAGLIAVRVQHGWDTPTGHRCSNLVEQLEEYDNAEGVPALRRELRRRIEQSMAELSELSK